MKMIRAFARLLAVAAFGIAHVGAHAAYPDHPIRLIVPYAAGGGTDLWARLYARKLGERLGQNVLVDNRPGGNTQIGAAAVAKAPADGYTLLFTSGTHIQQPALFPNLPYDVVDDFAPIGELGTTGLMFAVHPSVNAGNLREFVAQAKAARGKYNLGTYAAGSTGAVFGTYLSDSEGLGIPVVGYKGEAPAITDLVGGTIQGGFFSIPGVKAFVQSGRLKAIGALSRSRAPSFPEVPTLVEQGFSKFDWPGIWIGVFAPAKTPKDVVDRLAAESKALTQDAELRKAYLDVDVVTGWRGPTEFADDIKHEMALWKQLVQKLGIKAE